MKKLNVTWQDIHDSTGYLFSFAKALSCAVKNSPWAHLAEDVIATSGFAFRMWVSADFCPSATSIWSFDHQKPWVENSGLKCEYAGRYWGQDDIEEEKRLEAIEIIKKSINNGIPAISWDIGVPEWGLITGYSDDAKTFATRAVNGEGEMPYDALGKREIPILSVLTIVGKTEKPQEDIFKGTMAMAAGHLKGEEWCDNAKGLEAYPALIKHFQESFTPDASWNMEYFLGTFGELKYYAWKYFEKNNETRLAKIYKSVYEAWMTAYKTKSGEDINDEAVREKIVALLNAAYENEKQAAEIMSAYA
ncbi:MAG: hypothetical protein FWC32_12055 [Firmicutes bacterium]|nr:hypothetical protein [Bacillota bacterium]